MSSQNRPAIFISHATPEDNQITLWLGSKLSALGYEVWADIFRLSGGDDWERKLEDAIRNRAATFLLIASPHGVQKQGVRNEITIAIETGKKIQDPNFVVPLRIAAYESPLLIAHSQYIDFEKAWASGLTELLELLDERKVPRKPENSNADFWRELYLNKIPEVAPVPERLVSNWLPVVGMPKEIFFYDFQRGINLGLSQTSIRDAPIPMVQHNRGFISFAPIHQLQEYFGENLPVIFVAKIATDEYLAHGWKNRGIPWFEASRMFTDLTRQAANAFFTNKGLSSIETANGRLAWWPSKTRAPLSQISFSLPNGLNGRRQLIGYSKVRNVYWHYGVSCWTNTSPVPHLRVMGRVIFTTDGKNPVGSALKMHRMRRSFCKSWRNDKWRDLLLTFWHWVNDGSSQLNFPMGEGESLELDIAPILVDSAFGIQTPDELQQESDNVFDELALEQEIYSENDFEEDVTEEANVDE